MTATGEGVCVQASTLGSLEALLEFLKSPAVKIPVSGINIGPVHKKDIMRASVMLEKGRKKFACLLAFDVPVTREAREMAESLGVRVFTADIIYHLFDQFTAYLKTVGLYSGAPVLAAAAPTSDPNQHVCNIWQAMLGETTAAKGWFGPWSSYCCMQLLYAETQCKQKLDLATESQQS